MVTTEHRGRKARESLQYLVISIVEDYFLNLVQFFHPFIMDKPHSSPILLKYHVVVESVVEHNGVRRVAVTSVSPFRPKISTKRKITVSTAANWEQISTM